MLPDGRATPPFTEDGAVTLARRLYGLECGASALPGEFDDNFLLAGTDGRCFVLKAMHPARERGLVDLQCAALRHLEGRAPRLPLPRVVPTAAGEDVAVAAGPDGVPRLVWMLTHLPGTPLALARPRSVDLFLGLGRLLGEMDAALLDFDHPEAHREFKWDLARAAWVRGSLSHIGDPERRVLVERFLALYEDEVVPALTRLRRGVVHGDANDHNVLVGPPRPQPRAITGLIDFGDIHHGLLVAEPAVAAAYALLGEREPVAAASAVLGSYHAAFPLTEEEIALTFALVGTRLAVSVTNAALGRERGYEDPYVTISEAPAWDALRRLASVPPRLAHYRFREACGLSPTPRGAAVTAWLRERGPSAASVLDVDLRTARTVTLDLSVGSRLLGADPKAAQTEAFTATVLAAMREAGATVGIGRYDEARGLYTSPLFAASDKATEERRTIHLGIDLFVEAGTAVRAPLAGVVHLLACNDAPGDYGPLVILGHETDSGERFFTLYGHLSGDTLGGLTVGQPVAAGAHIGSVGTPPANGGWPPHLHFQLILDLLEAGADFPGVAFPSQRLVWTGLCPDPNLLLNIPADRFPPPPPAAARTLAERSVLLGPNLSVSYRQPLKIVRGFMQYLYDDLGRAYLDVYNNVPLVGHSHPRVVRAVQQQIGLLNTNTRYLHDTVVGYAERLTRRLPAPLRVCYFVNSGSEANELALRIARSHTRCEDVIVLEHAYHGHTTTLIDVSPYKFDGPGGAGRRPWVHVAPLPDGFRGRYRSEDPQAGPRYAGHVEEIVARLRAQGRGRTVFLAETLPSVAGQIVFPSRYLTEAYRHVRDGGGVCIADEVQTGFGRLGTHFWGFETQGVVPDVVVLGKPMGNGFPLAAVITTPSLAASFHNGMEFFSTFGGNPVAAAAGRAVLDVLDDEGLPERARRVGLYLMEGLRRLQHRHRIVGDVRGRGLFLGVDLVRDPQSREPAPEEAAYVVNRLRECGVLTGTDGPYDNVLKLRPPLVFSEADADLFLLALEAVLEEDGAQPSPSTDSSASPRRRSR